jgi:predicted NACHT family NTPase
LTDLENFSLFCYIKQEFYQCGITNQNTVEELLKYGRVLILLDGLDEVSEKHIEKTIKEVQDFCQKYHRNHFIMSCRIAAQQYDNFKKDFTYVEVADFNQDQIEFFAQNWFKAIDVKSSENGQAKAKQFIDKLSQEDNQQIRELAVTPILLGLTCLVFQKKGNFPSDRAELYKEGIEILLRTWDESRNIERDTIYKKLSIEHKKNLLLEVASQTFINERYFFKKDEILSYIAKYVRRISSVIYSTPPEEAHLIQDSANILRAIEVHHGLLVERFHNIYSFSHLTFQEYFTAQAVTLHKETFDYAVNNLFKKNWRETFLLASNIFGSADSLLLASKKQSDTLLSSNEKIQSFLNWLHHTAYCRFMRYSNSSL